MGMENLEIREFVSSRLKNVDHQNLDAIGSSIAVELINHCVGKGSKDNCTALLIQLGDPKTDDGPEHVSSSKELIQGKWRGSPTDIQTKYADFFECEGFVEEALAVREAIESGPQAVGSQ